MTDWNNKNTGHAQGETRVREKLRHLFGDNSRQQVSYALSWLFEAQVRERDPC